MGCSTRQSSIWRFRGGAGSGNFLNDLQQKKRSAFHNANQHNKGEKETSRTFAALRGRVSDSHEKRQGSRKANTAQASAAEDGRTDSSSPYRGRTVFPRRFTWLGGMTWPITKHHTAPTATSCAGPNLAEILESVKTYYQFALRDWDSFTRVSKNRISRSATTMERSKTPISMFRC